MSHLLVINLDIPEDHLTITHTLPRHHHQISITRVMEIEVIMLFQGHRPQVGIAIAPLQRIVGRVWVVPVVNIQDGTVDQAVGHIPGVFEHPGVVLIEDVGQGRGHPGRPGDAAVALADAQVDVPALALGDEVQDLPGMIRPEDLEAIPRG
jgi:hypothetical protein